MKRARSREDESIVSLDSFMDIVTNTLGLLILVATLTVISSRDMKISLGSPMMSEADEDLTCVFIECRNNRVVPIADDRIDDERNAIIDSEAPIRERILMVRRFNEREVSNEYHRFEFRPKTGTRSADNRTVVVPEVILTPTGPNVGDTVSDMEEPDCKFASQLAELSPDTHWVHFLVREDSFEALRAARALATKMGYQTGWTPKKSSEPIIFSPFGSTVGIDE